MKEEKKQTLNNNVVLDDLTLYQDNTDNSLVEDKPQVEEPLVADSETKDEPIVENKSETKEDNNIIDVDLDAKKDMVILDRFRIAHDNNRIIELNTRDIGVVSRFSKGYKKIQDYVSKIDDSDLAGINSLEDIDKALDSLDKHEKYIRSQINYIFGTDVCTPILQDLSVLATKNGTYAFEYVISEVLKFYEKSITKEANAIKSRVNKHTSKYW